MRHVIHYQTPTKAMPLGIVAESLYYVQAIDASSCLLKRVPTTQLSRLRRPSELFSITLSAPEASIDLATIPFSVKLFCNPVLSDCMKYFYAVGSEEGRQVCRC